MQPMQPAALNKHTVALHKVTTVLTMFARNHSKKIAKKVTQISSMLML